MAENILQARYEFISHLEGDIQKNIQILEQTKSERQKLQGAIEDITDLGKYPEHCSLIPLGKNIYMKGKIVHTGEYYIKKNVSTESYFVLKSLEQTLNGLQSEVSVKDKDIENIEYAKYQLEERMKILKGDESGVTENDDLPKEIKSEKGVAIKVGEFYEILEFEEDQLPSPDGS